VRAAVVDRVGGVATCREEAEPVLGADEVLVDVLGAGVHHYSLMWAEGRGHAGPLKLPYFPGGDGVGVLADGSRVFFESAGHRGSWAERAAAVAGSLVSLNDAVNAVDAAALGNTGICAYTALTWRAKLQAGETVLVLGATGAVGEIAIQVARALGAGKVIAAARESDRLRALPADELVALDGPDVAARMKAVTDGGADIVIDALWGAAAIAALQAAATGCRFVQVGNITGAEVGLPAGLLRPRRIDLLGHGLMACPEPVRRDAMCRLLELMTAGQLKVRSEVIPLADVGIAWARQKAGAGTKLVLTP